MDSSSAMQPSSELFSGNRKPPSGPLAGNKKPPSGPLGSKSKAPSPSDFLAGLSSSSGDDEDEVPDWLASIKAPEPPLAPAPSVPASPSPADAPADWMSGLRPESEPEKPQQPEKLDFGFSARDTWLDETPQKPAPVEQTCEDVADWLRTLDQGPGKAPAQPAVPSAPAPASFPAADEAVPDWLNPRGFSLPQREPEKVVAQPLELALREKYRYALLGTDTVDGTLTYMVAIEPEDPKAVLFTGKVWIDGVTFRQVRMQLEQRGGRSSILSHVETQEYRLVPSVGGREFNLLRSINARQLVSAAGRSLLVERTYAFTGYQINSPAFTSPRAEAMASDLRMYRDTDEGCVSCGPKGVPA